MRRARRAGTASPVQTSWLGTFRSALTVDRSHLANGPALSGSIGFVVPILVGLLAGRIEDGLTAALGALVVGFANLGGAYRARAATLLSASAAVASAALLGGLTGTVAWLTVLVTAAWGFAGALLVALGPRAAFVGMLSTWTLVVAADKNLEASEAGYQAVLIAAGALFQTIVALSSWLWRSHAPQRRATADAFAALAAYARRTDTQLLEVSAVALAEAATVARESTDPRELRRVEQAEWVRVQLTALARTPAGDDVRAAAAADLEALAAGRRPTFSELRRGVDGIDDPALQHRAAALLERLTAAADHEAGSTTASSGPSASTSPPVRRLLSILAGELTPRSAAFRHALRVAVALVVAVALSRLWPLDWGYWVPVTVLFVLKPDYGSTVGRVVARIVGTILGVATAAVVVAQLPLSPLGTVGLMAVLMFVAYALFPAGYGLFTFVQTVLVAFLIDLSSGPVDIAVEDRIIDTVVGAAIAILALLLWPIREAPRARRGLADYADANADWIGAVLHAYGGGPYDEAEVTARRLRARRARADAVAALGRALAEPRSRRPDAGPLLAVLCSLDDLAGTGAVLTAALDAGPRGGHPWSSPPTAQPDEDVTKYAAALDACLRQIAGSLCSGTRGALTPPRLPDDASGGDRLLSGEAELVSAALSRVA